MTHTDRADANRPSLHSSDRPERTRHLNQIDLSRRWTISPRTLERWRWLNEGPAYLKIGGRVAYRLEDVEAYEAAQTRTTIPDRDRCLARQNQQA